MSANLKTVESDLTAFKLLINGKLVPGANSRGVINPATVIADQNDLGGALTQHPDVAKVALTGSTATDREVMASVASTLKRITLELGGNDSAIILPGTNIKEVAPKIFMGAMINAGRVCLASTTPGSDVS